VSQEVSSGAQFSKARGTGWGMPEVCRAEILMILMPGGLTRGVGVYICLVPNPKWKFGLKLWQRNCHETGGGITITMNKLSSFLLCTAVTLCPIAAMPKTPPTLQPVNLGSAASFAVFGASGVMCTGSSAITGDVGVYPIAGTAVTGFLGENGGGACTVVGTIQDNDTALETVAGKHAFSSLAIAISDAKGRTGAFTPANSNLVSSSPLIPGLYKAGTTLTISGGTLYLSGKGVYIFQIGTQLLVTNATVVLENGASAADIFWRVGTSAILTTVTDFKGNILAGAEITMTTGTTLVGRALSQTAVTLI
jgi:hypothetical protein